MNRQLNIGAYFKVLNENRLAFESANELKTAVLHLFVVLLGIMLFAEIVVIITRYEEVMNDLSRGEGLLPFYFMASTLILPLIWLLLPPKQVHLDRLQGVVHHQQGKRAFTFPWERISFAHQWFPTKTGGSTLFALIATPPFPENLAKLIEKKKIRPPPGQAYQFSLGSFDVKSPEHGRAIFAFLDAWMHSQESAEALYASLVYSRFPD